MSSAAVLKKKWPVLARHEQAAIWLKVWIDLGRAPRTIDAYARGLAEYLLMCERDGIDPLTANRAHVATSTRPTATSTSSGPNSATTSKASCPPGPARVS